MTDNQLSPELSAAISARILICARFNGGDVRAAFDQVFGAGAYERLAREIYDAIRAKSVSED